MMNDAETVRDVLSSITGAPFEITLPGRNRLLLRREAVWFVACLDLAYVEKTAHLDRAWKDKEDIIWFESSELADVSRLVEHEYGEKGAVSMPDPEIGVPPPQTIPKEVAGFPRVVSILKRYERIVSEVSKRSGVPLKLLYDGGAGLTTVRIAVPTTSFNSCHENETRQVVKSVAKALREAYERVFEVKV